LRLPGSAPIDEVARLTDHARAAGCGALQDALIERAVRANTDVRNGMLADDALHVVLCGTGSPLPDADAAGPCTAVLGAGHFLLVDTGIGSWENIQLWKLPRADLSGILLTHFHSDHIGELGEAVFQSWAASGRDTGLPVHGPPGVERVVGGFVQAYSLDVDYRVAHHGPQVMPPRGGVASARPFPMPAEGESVLVLEDGGLRVTAFAVDHAPVSPSVGYRFDYRGRSVVVSGDTARSANLARHAKGADVLVHEALGAELVASMSEAAGRLGYERIERITRDILDYHTTPGEAKATADAAGVGLMVTTHNVPPLRNLLIERLFAPGLDHEGVVIGRDGMHFRLPVESTRIERGQLGD